MYGDGTASYRRRAKRKQREGGRRGGLRAQQQRREEHMNDDDRPTWADGIDEANAHAAQVAKERADEGIKIVTPQQYIEDKVVASKERQLARLQVFTDLKTSIEKVVEKCRDYTRDEMTTGQFAAQILLAVSETGGVAFDLDRTAQ